MQRSVRRLFCAMLCSSMLLTTAAISAECSKARMEATSLARTCCTALSTELDKARQECVEKIVKSIRRPKRLTADDQLAINMCIEECNYVENGYIEAVPPYALDHENFLDNLKTYLTDSKDQTLTFLLEAHKNCEIFLKNHGEQMDIKFPMVDIIDEACNPYALRLVTCVRMYGMQECPASLYLRTDSCKRAKKYFADCVAKIRVNLH